MESNIVNDLLQTYDKLRKRNYRFIVEDRRDDLQKQAKKASNNPVKTIQQNQGAAKDQASPGDVVQFDNSKNVSDRENESKYFIGPEGEQIPLEDENGNNETETNPAEAQDIFAKLEKTTKKWDGELGDERTNHALFYRLSAVQSGLDPTLDPSSAAIFAVNYFSKNFPVEWENFKNNKHLDFFGNILADLAQGPLFVGSPFTEEYSETEINSIANSLVAYREYIFTEMTLEKNFEKYTSEFIFQPLDGSRVRIFFQGEDRKRFIELKSDFITRFPKYKEIIPSFVPLSGNEGLYFSPSGEDFTSDLNILFRSFINNAFLFATQEISEDTFIYNITNSRDLINSLAAIYSTVKSFKYGESGYKILGQYESQVREWMDRLFDHLTLLQDNPYLITKEIYSISTISDNLWKMMHNLSLACAQGVKYIENTVGVSNVNVDYYFTLGGKPYIRLASIPVVNSKMKAVENLLFIDNEDAVKDLVDKLLEKFSQLSPDKTYNISKISNTKQLVNFIKRSILLNTDSEYREPYVVDVVKEYIDSYLGTEENIKNLIIHSNLHPYQTSPVMILDKRSLAVDIQKSKYNLKATDTGAVLFIDGKASIVFEVTRDAFIDMHILPELLQKYSISTELNPYLLPGFI